MKTLTIGTQGTASHDLECLIATIKKGTRVTITGIDPRYGYELVAVNGVRMVETGFDSIIPDDNK